MEAIHHYLLDYDHAKSQLVIDEDFGTDADAALESYSALEKQHKDNLSMDIVLVGSDSIETVKVTHSTYFGRSALDRIRKRGMTPA